MKKLTFLSFIFLLSFTSYSQFFENKLGIKKHEGFFTFYYDENNDKVFLQVDALNVEFLYVTALSEGVGSNDIGLDRGQLGAGVVVKFVRAGNKLLLLQPNLKYRAVTANLEEKKSVEEAFAKSVLHGFKIIENNKNTYLIDATDFFIRDAHGVGKTLKNLGQGTYMLDKTKSAFHIPRTKTFPENTEFDVLLTFTGKPIGKQIRSVTPNASLVTVHQHHSFVKLPEEGYQPRIYDPRCGSWQMTYMDYATPIDQPIVQRFIYRHRLQKKNPSAVVSEPVQPIVYYLDRGTPEPVRSALLEGGSWWDQAFEAIGYKNAFQIKMLPKGADPLDVRYNMIQWVHRSTRGWSYGGNISDPRTGEIIKGHVSLGSLRIRQDFLLAQALQAPYSGGIENDSFASELAIARIRQLSAHEIGHTLGFAHNFAASTYERSSVMDYPHPKITITNGRIDFSKAYDNKIGTWDKVAVAYAYQHFTENEELQLQKILDSAFAEGHRFISDADARPEGSAHAYAHLWDNGASAADELNNVLAVRNLAIANFSVANIKNNQPYSVLEDVFVPVYFYHRYQTEAVCKLLGGLDYTYAVKSQKNTIVKPVPLAEEQKALQVVLKTLSVEELAIPKRILALFPPRAYGYARSRESFQGKTGVSFDPYGAVQTAAAFTLRFLLNAQRANRLVQHNAIYEEQIDLAAVLDGIITASFKQNYKDTYYQELQEIIKTEVLHAMFALYSNDSVYPQVKAQLQQKITEVAEYLDKDFFKRFNTLQGVVYFGRANTKRLTVMDRQHVQTIIDFFKDPKSFQKIPAPKVPDGAPIGMVFSLRRSKIDGFIRKYMSGN
ncbi:zinc-dependent metalloprotease [Tenacibaculum sp. SG-28]|uniref:zinc-dependent metalloprotease n=1 Tax=Tenacibaculum sp. SG-28 TaxID=754426 RepID=UPI000CF40775|nr:zinc-dependent metalloprotease [Tenacibaculum sp. SG-28]PQJ23499.1 peptidase [Tenacibaculum sp. SG-28]